MSIKSNENTVGMHVSAITGAIGNLRNAGRIKGTDKGRTNYPEYRKAIPTMLRIRMKYQEEE